MEESFCQFEKHDAATTNTTTTTTTTTTTESFLHSQIYSLRSSIIIGRARALTTIYKLSTRYCYRGTHKYIYIITTTQRTKIPMCYIHSPVQKLLDICKNKNVFPSALVQVDINQTFS